LNFKCVNNDEEWVGKITHLDNRTNYYEFWIISRSSIMTILGSTSRGNFVCFPDFNVSCHLVDLNNTFWNTEKLTTILGTVDGITVASALSNLADKISI
jgi:hypothetical protein